MIGPESETSPNLTNKVVVGKEEEKINSNPDWYEEMKNDDNNDKT